MSSFAPEIFVFFLLITLGFILKHKFKKQSFKTGLKIYILNIALPATIFISIINFEISSNFLLYPLIALFFNIIIFAITPLILKIAKISDSKKKRTLLMLLPSFAPGLSCFPIINDFLGSEALAKASIIDFGNKFFVLLFLFFIAIRLHNVNQNNAIYNRRKSIKPMLKNFLYEPINIIIFVAIIFLWTGNTITNLPNLLIDFFSKISDTLTPVVLIFIGLSIILKRDVVMDIIPLLLLRSGICLLILTFLLQLTGYGFYTETKLFLILSISSVSFWPFAHMTFVNNIEKDIDKRNKTFDIKFGLNFLAYSLPFSTTLILFLFSNDSFLSNAINLYLISVFLIILGYGLAIFFNTKKNRFSRKKTLKNSLTPQILSNKPLSTQK